MESVKLFIEVLEYMRSCQCSQMKDKHEIRKLLNEYKYEFRFNNKDKTLPDLTYDHFIRWFNSKQPRKGDLVYFPGQGICGIVNGLMYTGIILAAYIKEGVFSTEPRVVEYSEYKKMNTQQSIGLQNAFYDNHIAWNKRDSKIVSCLELKENMQVRITRLGNQLGAGVFKETDMSGNAIFYCLMYNGSSPKYSMSENIGKIRDFQLEYLPSDERLAFKQELENHGIVWNGYKKRVEPVNYRIKGQRYYYISGNWNIREVVDKGSRTDNQRYARGNYFPRESNAALFLKMMEKRRTDFFIENELIANED